jgi:hypothetical protein
MPIYQQEQVVMFNVYRLVLSERLFGLTSSRKMNLNLIIFHIGSLGPSGGLGSGKSILIC